MIFYNRSHDHLLFVDACLFSFQRTICARRSEATLIIYHTTALNVNSFLIYFFIIKMLLTCSRLFLYTITGDAQSQHVYPLKKLGKISRTFFFYI